MPSFNDYIVYVDESGDHSLDKINPQFPAFVLACCLFQKSEYADHCAPAMIRFKFEHIGHDQVVLHEREIRKQAPPFDFLRVAESRMRFMDGLNDLITSAPFTIVAAAIRKETYVSRYVHRDNPYHIALKFCLERLYRHLAETVGCEGGALHIVFEQRGQKEDTELELEFRRACDGHNIRGWTYPFEFILADKRGNSTGLQLADLVARPIGLYVLQPQQPNRAWDILETKLRRSPSGKAWGWGLKVFP